MKKLILLLTATVLTMSAHAYDYPYLTFQNSDGTQTSVSVESLSITVNDGNLVCTNSDGTTNISIAELSKMFFSTDGTPTGISAVSTKTSGDVEIYTLTGISLGKFQSLSQAKDNLNSGIYLIKSDTGTSKIAIR